MSAVADALVEVRSRPVIAFFEYADVFVYPQHGIGQREFATRWHGSGNHAFLRLLQRGVGDVTWWEFSVAPELREAKHLWTGATVRIVPSSTAHRGLWRLFYGLTASWRSRRLYRWYEIPASYLATLSAPFVRQLREMRPDVLFVQDYANGRFDVLFVLARLLGIPLIAYHAGSRPERYVGRSLKRWTIRRADRILVSSRRELEMLATRFKVPRERMEVLLTPIDCDVFRPLADDATLAEQLTSTLAAVLRDPALARSYRSRARDIAERRVSFAAVGATLRAIFQCAR